MARSTGGKAAKARKLRAQAKKLCKTSNQLRNEAEGLYEQADEAAAEAKELLATVDRLFARANALHGHMLRRKCLKCGGAFGSTGIGNRLCRTCRAANRALHEAPSTPPKCNGQPMYEARVKL